jgi:hypothetical protein
MYELRPSDASDAADPGLGAAGREARLALLVVVADDELDCTRRVISRRINKAILKMTYFA